MSEPTCNGVHWPYVTSTLILDNAEQFPWRIGATHYPDTDARTLEIVGLTVQMPCALWPQFEAAVRRALDNPRVVHVAPKEPTHAD